MAFSLDLIRPGEGTATRYTLQDGSYLIGRGSSCHVQLPYPEVSERHALLLLRGETSRLEDLHSANGTYINGIPVDGIVGPVFRGDHLPVAVFPCGEGCTHPNLRRDDALLLDTSEDLYRS